MASPTGSRDPGGGDHRLQVIWWFGSISPVADVLYFPTVWLLAVVAMMMSNFTEKYISEGGNQLTVSEPAINIHFTVLGEKIGT